MRIDGPGLGWQHSVKAKSDVKTMFLSFRKFSDLSIKHPEFEADGRAGMSSLEECLAESMKSILSGI